MIDGLKPYPKMKDSGVPWLGNVPEHWEVKTIGRMGRLFKGNGGSKADEVAVGVPCVRYGDLYTRHEFFIQETKACVSTDQAEAYTPIEYGDLLFAASGETMEDIGRSSVNLLRSPACCGGDILVLRPEVPVDPRFLGYAADAPSTRHQKATMGRGFTVVHVYASQIKQLVLPVPPLPEQAAIACFLDHANRLIRRYIRATKKLITLLNEQKQAIIHQAVTRGLDPNVRLKPSGIEWLGDVPEHWNVRKLRQCGTIMGGMTPSMSVRRYWDGTVPWVTPKDMKRFTIGDSIVKLTEHAVRETPIRLIEPPAVLLVVRGMILARRVPVALSIEHVTINQDMKALKPFPGISAEFLARSLDSAQTAFFPLIDEAGHGTRRLPTERWRNLAVAIPPENEQAEILDFINANTRQLDAAIDRAHSEITLLQEFRGTLIADVVTGKIDVREAAARLPDEDEDPEPLDEPEEPLEDGEAFDEVAMEAGAS